MNEHEHHYVKLISCPHDPSIIHIYWASQGTFTTAYERTEHDIFTTNKRVQLIIHRLEDDDEASVLLFTERGKQ